MLFLIKSVMAYSYRVKQKSPLGCILLIAIPAVCAVVGIVQSDLSWWEMVLFLAIVLIPAFFLIASLLIISDCPEKFSKTEKVILIGGGVVLVVIALLLLVNLIKTFFF